MRASAEGVYPRNRKPPLAGSQSGITQSTSQTKGVFGLAHQAANQRRMLAKSGKPEGASSLSSLPHMGSQGTANNQNQSARSNAGAERPGFQPGVSAIRAQILAEMQPPPKDED